MATAEVEQPPATPQLPDYVLDPNAILNDQADWRYGRAPDYSKTRAVYAETKKFSHVAGSLPDLVENLVKNWEVEASFKVDLKDWRTIDRANYSFAINGGPPQDGEHMLKVGTYNAIIAPNEYYCPNHSDFASSHKTFKRMMPNFAWEVMEVYSGPPHVAFRWRHWGVMKNDYVGFNDKGEKVTAKAHGGAIDIQGITTATVNDKLQLQRVETWFDPLEMFRQIAPRGVVNKIPVSNQADLPSEAPIISSSSHADSSESKAALTGSCPFNHGANTITHLGAGASTGAEEDAKDDPESFHDAAEHADARSVHSRNVSSSASDWTKVSASDSAPGSPENHQTADFRPSQYSSSVTGAGEPTKPSEAELRTHRDAADEHLEKSASVVHPHPHDVEEKIKPVPGAAVVAAVGSKEAVATHEEMSLVKEAEEKLLLNKE